VKKIIAVLTLGCLVHGPADAQRPASFVCTSESSTGFRIDKATGRWRAAQFKPYRKYIVTQSTSDRLSWEVRPIGSPTPLARCSSNPQFNPQTLRCSGHEELWIDINSLRFMSAYPHGYWDSGQESEPGIRQKEDYATPSMDIGQCSPL